MTVTKARIIDAVFKTTEIPRKTAHAAVETLLTILKKTLAGEEDVMVSGFGKFQVKRKSARRGRNPQTGGALDLRPRRVVAFRLSGQLRRKINGEEVDSATDDDLDSEDGTRTKTEGKSDKK
jgi:integration host factor subunit alpha